MLKLNIDINGLKHLGRLSGGYFITTFINQSLPFLILPILTWYLSPSEYANLALFSLYLALSNALTGVSIPAVISKHFFSSEKSYIAQIIGNSIVVNATLSVFTILLILVIYPYLQNVLELNLIWLLMIPVASFSFIVFSIGLNIMRNNRKIVSFGKYQIGNTIINLCVSLFLIMFLLWGWQGRVLGIIIAYIVSAIIAFGYLKRNGYLNFTISRKIIKMILKVVLPLIPNSLQAVIIAQVGIFFMNYYFTKEILGLYSIGFQIGVMVQLLVSTLNLSWTPYLYEQIAKKEIANKLYLTRMYFAFIGVVIIGIIGINLTAGLILRVMTTPAYYGAAEFIPWFTVGFLFYGCYVFLMPILINHDHQKYISKVTFINMILMIVFNFWFIDIWGYIGITYAFGTTYFIMFCAFFFKVQKIMPLPWIQALKIWK